jgi:hypothetical protein
MSKILSTVAVLGMSVAEAKVSQLNDVIFATQVNHNAFGNVQKVDDKTYVLDTQANTADLLTPQEISKAAVSGLSATKLTTMERAAVAVAEQFGMVDSITLTRKADTPASGSTALFALAKSMNAKVADIELTVQNDIIFKTAGIRNLPALTEHDGKYFKIDTASNSATVVNPDAIVEIAKADFLKGKASDFTRFCEMYGLIASVTLTKKGADKDENADS